MTEDKPLAQATPEQVKSYWLDKCPVCGADVKFACRCPESHRTCANRHTWRRDNNGYAITEKEQA